MGTLACSSKTNTKFNEEYEYKRRQQNLCSQCQRAKPTKSQQQPINRQKTTKNAYSQIDNKASLLESDRGNDQIHIHVQQTQVTHNVSISLSAAPAVVKSNPRITHYSSNTATTTTAMTPVTPLNVDSTPGTLTSSHLNNGFVFLDFSSGNRLEISTRADDLQLPVLKNGTFSPFSPLFFRNAKNGLRMPAYGVAVDEEEEDDEDDGDDDDDDDDDERKQEILSLNDEDDADADDDDDDDDEEEPEMDVYVPPPTDITVGDEVELLDMYHSLQGTVKFIGPIISSMHADGSEQVWYGLQLTRVLNKQLKRAVHQCRFNNKLTRACAGHVDGVEYFECGDDQEGLFVRRSQIQRVVRVNYDAPRIYPNQLVDVPSSAGGGRGWIRYIGKPHSDDDCNEDDIHIHAVYCGIETIPSSGGGGGGSDGLFHGRRYFQCTTHSAVFVDISELSRYIVPSRFNLLCHGLQQCARINIASGVVKLIESYCNVLEFRLTAHPSSAHKKFEAFDVSNNIHGSSITAIACGGHTQRKVCKTLIAGHYQFFKSKCIDIGDRHTHWVHKTEYEITRVLHHGGTEKIFRHISTDNPLPIFRDYASFRTQFRHDIHRDDVDNCDAKKVFAEICALYGLQAHDMAQQLQRHKIKLYGLDNYL